MSVLLRVVAILAGLYRQAETPKDSAWLLDRERMQKKLQQTLEGLSIPD